MRKPQSVGACTPARAFFASEAGADAAVPLAVVESILEAACGRAETAENLRSDPPAFASKGFLRKLGLTGTDARAVTWTAELIGRGLAVYASCAQEPVAAFTDVVRSDLEMWAEELARKVRRLEREANAVVRVLDGPSTRKQPVACLLGGGRDERIAKYERHLHTLLTSTLHELERLQARREGQVVAPPAVADVNVTVDARPS